MAAFHDDLSRAEKAAGALKNGDGGQHLVCNADHMAAHLYALFAPEFVQPFPDAWIEIALGDPITGEVNSAGNFSVFELKDAAEFAHLKNAEGHNVYVAPALRQGERTGRADDAAAFTASHAWAEFDGAGDARRIAAVLKTLNLKPAMSLITGTVPHTRAHLYFRLRESPTPAQLRAVNTALMKALGSDAVHNNSRVMRLAGTINFPSPKKRKRGYVAELVSFHPVREPAKYPLDNLLALTPEAPKSTNGTGGERARRTDEDLIALLKTSRGTSQWHTSLRDTIASMIGRGWGNLEIRLACAPYCDGGADDRDLLKLIVTGRKKFDKPDEKPEPDVSAEAELEPPRLLIREVVPADPFPVEALGDLLGAAARGIQDVVQAPAAVCSQSVLAAATLAVQGYSDIELSVRRIRPISGFFLTVAATGERKTSTDDDALLAIVKREKALKDDYDIRFPQYKVALLAWEKARDAAVKAANGVQCEIVAAINALGPEPMPPLLPMLTCPEPTIEGLYKLLAAGQPAIGIFSSEGGQFIGGHGMNDEAKLRTATGLSGLWDGTPIKRVRAVDGISVMTGRRLSLHLMCQPDVAARMLSDSDLLDQGLLSRCLVAAPTSTAGTRLSHDPDPASDIAINRYNDTLLRILRRPLPLAVGSNNELSPPVIKLSKEATALWKVFADDIEIKMTPDGELSTILGLANKLAEHAARLAAVLTLVEDIEAREIPVEKMASGIILAQYYAAEALRLFEVSKVTSDLHLAQKLLDWLIGTWTEGLISLPDVYQFGPRAIREKATAARMVAILADHGWLIRVEGGGRVSGHYRRDVFRIVKG